MDNKSIMVAVDFGPTSTRAFETAVELAARLGAPLDIVNVCPPLPIEADAAAADAPYVANAREELAKLQAAAEQRGVRARTHLRQEVVVFGLLEAIEELEPQLAVVGSHGRHGFARALLGSVSDSLARRSHVPIVIVPSPERKQQAATVAWSCADCGHILGDGEPTERCVRCDTAPARWLSATVSAEPADAGQPTVGEPVTSDREPVQAGGRGGFFATSPAGGNDRTELNPELRVRY